MSAGRAGRRPGQLRVGSACAAAARGEEMRCQETHGLSYSSPTFPHPGSWMFLESADHSISSLSTPLLLRRPPVTGGSVWPGDGLRDREPGWEGCTHWGAWGVGLFPLSAALLPGLPLPQRPGDALLLEVRHAASSWDLLHPRDGGPLERPPWRRWEKGKWALLLAAGGARCPSLSPGGQACLRAASKQGFGIFYRNVEAV